MLVATDPKTGVVSVTLSPSDRKRLAAAHTVVDRLAYHLRHAADGQRFRLLADSLRDLLDPPGPATAQPAPKAKADG